MADVVVIGGGPAGSAFAVTAARSGHAVTLLDEGRRLRSWPGESLPAGGGELVASVFGAHVLDGHVKAYGTAAAWGSDALVSHDSMGHWSGHGWHLDRAAFDAALREVAVSVGVTVVERHVATIDQGEADWLVDASGRAGAVVSRLGIPRIRVDEQVALVGLVPDRGGERVTTVEAVREGWWYSTPLTDGQRVVALVTDVDLVASERVTTWAASLASTKHISDLAGSCTGVEVSAYPADTAYREQIVGDGWLAVGDAAVCFDPLSSQGLITGIVMGARAAAMLDTGLAQWVVDYRAVLDEHIAVRAEFLEAETRWPDAPFWRTRTLQAR